MDGIQVAKLVIALIGGPLTVCGTPLAVDDSPYNGVLGAKMEVRNGLKMMQLKGFSEVPGGNVAISWSFPTSISVGGIPYRVVRGLSAGGFEIYEQLATNSMRIATGRLTRMSNGTYARTCGFGVMGTSSLGVRTMALQTDVRVLDDATNAIYLACSNRPSEAEEVLIYKNLYMRISASTNTFGIATALLKSGLSSRERLYFSENVRALLNAGRPETE